jgi:hypothetical protein
MGYFEMTRPTHMKGLFQIVGLAVLFNVVASQLSQFSLINDAFPHCCREREEANQIIGNRQADSACA